MPCMKGGRGLSPEKCRHVSVGGGGWKCGTRSRVSSEQSGKASESKVEYFKQHPSGNGTRQSRSCRDQQQQQPRGARWESDARSIACRFADPVENEGQRAAGNTSTKPGGRLSVFN
jgi:hypothetical protein